MVELLLLLLDNNATLPTTSTASNNTGNLTEHGCQRHLAVHNRERAAVGVPPLVWSDKLAADAQVWADHMATTGQIAHDASIWQRSARVRALQGIFTENVHGTFPREQTWCTRPDRRVAGELGCRKTQISRRNNDFGQLSRVRSLHADGLEDTKEVGCGFAGSVSPVGHSGVPLLRPPGNYFGQKPY